MESGESRGRPPLIETLPPPDTERWVVRRKAAVVAAVRNGGITIADVCRTYQLTEEEFLSWARAFEIHGLAGLRATRPQRDRARPAPATSFGPVETAD
jgi:transposase-like protein